MSPAVYREDLAWIHHAGFGEFAESAASGILELLWKQRIHDGLIADIGCGSGILARELTRAGFEVLGIDASAAMIELARDVAPLARFESGSFADLQLPRCRAIVAIGEVLNYGTAEDLRAFLAGAAAALDHDGMLLFDLAEPEAYPIRDERRLGGDDWSVIVVKERHGAHLTRNVTTFRRIGEEIRRDHETHTLELFDRDEVLAMLTDAGFRVRMRRSYGSRRLPKGLLVYVCARAR